MVSDTRPSLSSCSPVQFQGNVRIVLLAENLSDGCHAFFLDGERVIVPLPVEVCSVQETHIMRWGTFPIHRLLSVHLGVALSKKGDVHVLSPQLHLSLRAGSAGVGSKGDKVRAVEVHFKIHLHAGHHDLFRVEGGQIGLHDQADHVVALEGDGGCLERGRLSMPPANCSAFVVVGTAGGKSGLHVEETDPRLRLQERVTVIAAVFEQGLKKGRVGIRVGLFAHKGSIEPQVDEPAKIEHIRDRTTSVGIRVRHVYSKPGPSGGQPDGYERGRRKPVTETADGPPQDLISNLCD